MAIDGKTVGLALSGGGYRATLFGLGSLWRLNDAGLLGRLDRITSVSGGSIVAGVLAHRWGELQFVDGRAGNFEAAVASPVQAFCTQTIDLGTTIKGWLNPFKSAGDYLIDRYRKDLFGSTTLKDLPPAAAGSVPRFVFYATNLQTGRSLRFRQDMVADYLIGVNRALVVPLAAAVAASSAFPPLFSPIELDCDSADWTEGSPLPQFVALRSHLKLADGGIYDNMGLETLVDNVDIVLVSDAGSSFEFEDDPAEDPVRQLGRVRDILIDQTRALRKRWLISEFDAGRKHGAYWGVGTQIGAYAATTPLCADSAHSDALAHVPTRLKALDTGQQGRLINWGYALCDAALRTRAAVSVAAATTFPCPAWSL